VIDTARAESGIRARFFGVSRNLARIVARRVTALFP